MSERRRANGSRAKGANWTLTLAKVRRIAGTNFPRALSQSLQLLHRVPDASDVLPSRKVRAILRNDRPTARAPPPLSLSLSLCVWVCVCLHMCMCGRARAHTHTHATLARPAAADTQAPLSATLRVRLYVHLDFLRNSANMDIRMRLHNALFINIIRHFVNMNLIPPTPSAALRHGL
jgi:hypothetical protein